MNGASVCSLGEFFASLGQHADRHERRGLRIAMCGSRDLEPMVAGASDARASRAAESEELSDLARDERGDSAPRAARNDLSATHGLKKR
jgi:hypothetical protein